MYFQAAQPDPIEIQRQQEQRRRMVVRKRAKEELRPRSPDAVEGMYISVRQYTTREPQPSILCGIN